MLSRRFVDAVRVRLINAAMRVPQALAARQEPANEVWAENEAVLFVDLQNLHYFLTQNCKISATQVHIVNLFRDWARTKDMSLREIRVYTGIHDARREPEKHEAMRRRIRWMESAGAKVTALPLSYHFDRATGETRAHEKGVDVRIALEIVQLVTERHLRKAILITQDRDISQAVTKALEIARSRGEPFVAYSPTLTGMEWEHNGKCGLHGIAETERLELPLELVRKHQRRDR